MFGLTKLNWNAIKRFEIRKGFIIFVDSFYEDYETFFLLVIKLDYLHKFDILNTTRTNLLETI